jgi:phage shock protein A
MNIKDRLRHVFKETFLDLFQDESPSPETLESALAQARTGVKEATDALAAFTVTHLHLTEERRHFTEQIETVTKQLEEALASGNDDLARSLIRKRQVLNRDAAPVEQRVQKSTWQKLELQERVEALKAQVLEIERKKLDLQLRDRAAEAMDQVSQGENSVGRAHDFATGTEAETTTLQKEAAIEVSEDERNTLDSRLNTLLEEDEVEQELARLKQQRKP